MCGLSSVYDSTAVSGFGYGITWGTIYYEEKRLVLKASNVVVLVVDDGIDSICFTSVILVENE